MVVRSEVSPGRILGSLRDVAMVRFMFHSGTLRQMLALVSNTCTVSIVIDAHAQIDAHPPSSASFWHTEMDEIDDFVSKMQGSMMNSLYICNFSVP